MNYENPPPYPGPGPTAPYPPYTQQPSGPGPYPAYQPGPAGPYPAGQPGYNYPPYGWQNAPPPGPVYADGPKNTGKTGISISVLCPQPGEEIIRNVMHVCCGRTAKRYLW